MEDKVSVWMVLTLLSTGVTFGLLITGAWWYSFIPLSLTLAFGIAWVRGEQTVEKTWCKICWDRVEEHDDEGWGHKANEG